MEGKPIPEDTSTSKPLIEFKKPVLFGRVGKLPKKANKDQKDKADKNKPQIPGGSISASISDSELAKRELLAPDTDDDSILVPYKVPKWSGKCPDGSEYELEVIKSGMIVDKIDLMKKPYYVFGRLSNCEVVMGHPTISRYHCVLQYKAFSSEFERPCGWYLFDLGSTHGTFLNKEQLKPRCYTRIRVGHQIKFGISTRTFIMLGPEFDCEGESNLSATEIMQRARNMKLEKQRMIEDDMERRAKNRKEEEKLTQEQGIDWGMGEDAEEEPDLADNPYASTANEDLYLDDPKKTLRGYFEREGHELNYDCEERGVGQFICRVELPIDDARGRPMVAEVIHRGKKKEAVVACALEACRVLDRAGLLRQSKHESRRKKQRDWSADDYYDSDEDTFLDRTGSVERKRQRRMLKHGALEETKGDKALTYDDLLKQITEIETKIAAEEKCLEQLRSAHGTESGIDDDLDPLDTYMSSLGKKGKSMAQKAEISKSRMSIQKLKGELTKTQRLAEIARPAHLPPLIKKGESKMAVKMASNSVVYGKRIRLKEDTDRKPKVRKEVKAEEEEFVEEMDSDDEEVDEKVDLILQASSETADNDERDKPMSVDSAASSHEKTAGGGENELVHTAPKSEEFEKKEVTEKIKQQGDNKEEVDNKKEHVDNKNKEVDNKEEQVEKKKEEVDKKKEDVHKQKKEVKKKEEVDKKKKEVENSGPVSTKKLYGPMMPPENYVIPENYFDQETDRDMPEQIDSDE